jgi:hypothetical protein
MVGGASAGGLGMAGACGGVLERRVLTGLNTEVATAGRMVDRDAEEVPAGTGRTALAPLGAS